MYLLFFFIGKVGTFHSICSKILRWYPCTGIDKNFVIYDEKDSERVVKQILGAVRSTLLWDLLIEKIWEMTMVTKIPHIVC